jgi:hypothetical protein
MKVLSLIMVGVSLTAFGAENAQVLFKELATPGTSGVRRDALVTKLSGHTFSEIGIQVAQAICRSQRFGFHSPMTAKPWLEESCPEEEKIRHAAGVVWQAIIERAEAGSLAEPLARLCSEDRPENERMIYLDALLDRHYDDRVKVTLERIAYDKAQPQGIEIKVAEILVQRADANAYLRLLMKACDRIKDSLPRSERFRFATERLSGKISAESKKLLLNYGFAQLSQIDDGKSGKGYFLAMHLGDVAGIKPVREGQGAFAPDQRLPQYQGERGLKDSFFQDTVDNAQKWWRKNQKDFM